MYINVAHELMTSPLGEIYNHKIGHTLDLLEGLIDRIHFSVRFSWHLLLKRQLCGTGGVGFLGSVSHDVVIRDLRVYTLRHLIGPKGASDISLSLIHITSPSSALHKVSPA